MKAFSIALAALMAATFLLTLTVADSTPVTYQYLIGTDFLCGLDPGACPTITMADNGDTIALTGSGSFTTKDKIVTGSGNFVHKDASGNVIGEGTWVAEELISFHSYGSGEAQGLPANLFGGQTLLRVHLTPNGGGSGFDAILQIDCELGDKIPASAHEGIRLNVQDAINFNKEVSGFTVFVKQ